MTPPVDTDPPTLPIAGVSVSAHSCPAWLPGLTGVEPALQSAMRVELRDFGITLFDRWTAMWNGDVAVASAIMADTFALHYAQANTERVDNVRTPAGLAELVQFWHSFRPGIRFSAEGDAAVDLELVDGAPSGRIARPYLAVFRDANGDLVAR